MIADAHQRHANYCELDSTTRTNHHQVEHILSRIISRSISAKAANKCNRNFDIGLSAPVSMDSVGLRKRIPKPTSSWMLRTPDWDLQRRDVGISRNERRRKHPDPVDRGKPPEVLKND